MMQKLALRLGLPLALLLAGMFLLTRAGAPLAESTQRTRAVRQVAALAAPAAPADAPTGEYGPILPARVAMRDVPEGVFPGLSQYERWLQGEVDLENDFRLSEGDVARLREEALARGVDGTVQQATTGSGAVVLDSFPSIDFSQGSNAVPPDPEMAAGPDHLIAVVNLALEIYDKAGNSLYGPVASDAFFAGNPGCYGTFDPTVVYDEAADRFVIGIDADGVNYCAAVSATADPLGAWNIYAVPANISGAFHDYPHTGVGEDAIYVGANQFGGGLPGGFEGRIWALDKAAMYAGAAMTPITFSTGYDYGTPQPLHLHGFLQGTWPDTGAHYFVTDLYDGSTVQVWEWVDALGGGVPTIVSSIDLGPGGFPVDAPQLGGSPVTANDWRMRMFEYRDGSGWITDSISCDPGGGTVNCVRWAQIDLTTSPPSLVQSGVYGDEDHRIFPDLAVNECGDMLLGYTKTGSSMYPGIWFAGRESGDAPGTLGPEAELKAGEVPYTAYDPVPRRWGDYTGMTIDPDGTTFWYLGEYSKDIGGPALWGTYIGSFAYPGCGGPTPPLQTMDYIYRLDDNYVGYGTYDLYDDGTFTSTEGGGGVWQYVPLIDLIIIQHDPGYSCTALALGLFRGIDSVLGIRICFDFSGRSGVWAGEINHATLEMLRQSQGQEVPLPDGVDLDRFLRQYGAGRDAR